jgi:FMN phosphatase YigB (HAD superfamily)
MTKKIVLADIDNTLYDWGAFFAPSFRAMVYALVRELRVPEEQIYGEFKKVFARHGSLDYAFVIQELDSVQGLETEEIRHLIRTGRGAFLSVQRRRLRPYPGVPETLKWLLNQNFAVVGITNSPIHRAQKRLFDLKLDSLLTGLVAWEGIGADFDPVTDGYIRPARQRTRTRLPRSVPVPLSECKPNEQHYAIALEAFAGTPSEAWAIGDSLSKDLKPAAKLGVKTIWARYGAGFDPQDRDASTLLRITHWTESEISRTYSTDAFEPDYVVDSIEEIKEIVPATVMSLF